MFHDIYFFLYNQWEGRQKMGMDSYLLLHFYRSLEKEGFTFLSDFKLLKLIVCQLNFLTLSAINQK